MIQVLKAGRTLKLVLFVSGELRVGLGWVGLLLQWEEPFLVDLIFLGYLVQLQI